MKTQSPIIICGTHRSGTSLLCRVIEAQGISFGWRVDENNESLLFQRLNDMLLRQCGGSWDNPTPYGLLKNNQIAEGVLREYIETTLTSIVARSHFGFSSLKSLQRMWGWKDPRNLITLDLWLKIFPNAKVIFIARHGVDVASSLVTRSERIIETYENKRGLSRRVRDHLEVRKYGVLDSIRTQRLEDGFKIWEVYMEEQMRLEKTIDNDYLSLRYEDFLLDPHHVQQQILTFLSISKPEGPSEIPLEVDPKRAFSFKQNEDLVRFSIGCQDVLSKYGY